MVASTLEARSISATTHTILPNYNDLGGRIRVAGSVPGTAVPQDPNNTNHVIFQSFYHLQRPALLLAQGQVWCVCGGLISGFDVRAGAAAVHTSCRRLLCRCWSRSAAVMSK